MTNFDAEVRQIKTMVDHTYNVTLNIPEYNLKQVQELMGMLGDMIAVAIVRVDESPDSRKSNRK